MFEEDGIRVWGKNFTVRFKNLLIRKQCLSGIPADISLKQDLRTILAIP